MVQAGIEQDMEMFFDDQRKSAIRAIKNDMVERVEQIKSSLNL